MNVICSKEMIFGGAPPPPTKKGGETELRVEWINALKHWEPFGCPRGLALGARQNSAPQGAEPLLQSFLVGRGFSGASCFPTTGDREGAEFYVHRFTTTHSHTDTPSHGPPLTLLTAPPPIYTGTLSHTHTPALTYILCM